MSTDLKLQELDAHPCLNRGEAPDAESGAAALAGASGWRKVTDVLNKHYTNPDIEAAHILCAVIASHAIKEFPPVRNLAIAPPGSMKTALLEGFRGLPRVCFVDEITPKTFLSGKVALEDLELSGVLVPACAFGLCPRGLHVCPCTGRRWRSL
jgi:hypothetical protein